jgi:hypothetical protein
MPFSNYLALKKLGNFPKDFTTARIFFLRLNANSFWKLAMKHKSCLYLDFVLKKVLEAVEPEVKGLKRCYPSFFH